MPGGDDPAVEFMELPVFRILDRGLHGSPRLVGIHGLKIRRLEIGIDVGERHPICAELRADQPEESGLVMFGKGLRVLNQLIGLEVPLPKQCRLVDRLMGRLLGEGSPPPSRAVSTRLAALSHNESCALDVGFTEGVGPLKALQILYFRGESLNHRAKVGMKISRRGPGPVARRDHSGR